MSHAHKVTHTTNGLVHVTFYVILFRHVPHSSQDRQHCALQTANTQELITTLAAVIMAEVTMITNYKLSQLDKALTEMKPFVDYSQFNY